MAGIWQLICDTEHRSITGWHGITGQ